MNIFVKSKFSNSTTSKIQPLSIGTKFSNSNSIGLILTGTPGKGDNLKLSIENIQFYVNEKNSTASSSSSAALLTKKVKYAVDDSHIYEKLESKNNFGLGSAVSLEDSPFQIFHFSNDGLQRVTGSLESYTTIEGCAAYLLKYHNVDNLNSTPKFVKFRVVYRKSVDIGGHGQPMQTHGDVVSEYEYGVRLYENQSIIIGSIFSKNTSITESPPRNPSEFTGLCSLKNIVSLISVMISSDQFNVRSDFNIFQLDVDSTNWLIQLALEFTYVLNQLVCPLSPTLYRDDLLDCINNLYEPVIKKSYASSTSSLTGEVLASYGLNNYIWIYEFNPWVALLAIGQIILHYPPTPLPPAATGTATSTGTGSAITSSSVHHHSSAKTTTAATHNWDSFWVMAKGLVYLDKMKYQLQNDSANLIPDVNLKFSKLVHNKLKKSLAFRFALEFLLNLDKKRLHTSVSALSHASVPSFLQQPQFSQEKCFAAYSGVIQLMMEYKFKKRDDFAKCHYEHLTDVTLINWIRKMARSIRNYSVQDTIIHFFREYDEKLAGKHDIHHPTIIVKKDEDILKLMKTTQNLSFESMFLYFRALESCDTAESPDGLFNSFLTQVDTASHQLDIWTTAKQCINLSYQRHMESSGGSTQGLLDAVLVCVASASADIMSQDERCAYEGLCHRLLPHTSGSFLSSSSSSLSQHNSPSVKQLTTQFQYALSMWRNIIAATVFMSSALTTQTGSTDKNNSIATSTLTSTMTVLDDILQKYQQSIEHARQLFNDAYTAYVDQKLSMNEYKQSAIKIMKSIATGSDYADDSSNMNTNALYCQSLSPSLLVYLDVVQSMSTTPSMPQKDIVFARYLFNTMSSSENTAAFYPLPGHPAVPMAYDTILVRNNQHNSSSCNSNSNSSDLLTTANSSKMSVVETNSRRHDHQANNNNNDNITLLYSWTVLDTNTTSRLDFTRNFPGSSSRGLKGGCFITMSTMDNNDDDNQIAPTHLVVSDTHSHSLWYIPCTNQFRESPSLASNKNHHDDSDDDQPQLKKFQLFAGSKTRQSGYADGAVDDALFHSPSGLVTLSHACFVVCDTGNHLLRRVRLVQRPSSVTVKATHSPWVVDTLAGVTQVTGQIDGDAVNVARLTAPYQVCVNNLKKSIYFTQQGSSLVSTGSTVATVTSPPCVRAYVIKQSWDELCSLDVSMLHGEIVTIHSGAPFIHLNGLCCDTSASLLLVCDSGAGCIFGVQLENNQSVSITVKISADRIYEVSAACFAQQEINCVLKLYHNHHHTHTNKNFDKNANKVKAAKKNSSSSSSTGFSSSPPLVSPTHTFYPLAVAVVATGHYVFTDRHSQEILYTYYDTTISESLSVSGQRRCDLNSSIMQSYYKELSLFKMSAMQKTNVYAERLQQFLKCVSNVSSFSLRLKNKQIICDYANEVLNYITFEDKFGTLATFTPHLLLSMLSHAPSILSTHMVIYYILQKLDRLRKLQDSNLRGGLGRSGLSAYMRGTAAGLDDEDDLMDIDQHFQQQQHNRYMNDDMRGGNNDDDMIAAALDNATSSGGANSRSMIHEYSNLMREVIDRVCEFFSKFDFNNAAVDADEELSALQVAIELFPEDASMHRQKILAAALKNKSFQYPVNSKVIEILSTGLGFSTLYDVENEQNNPNMFSGMGVGLQHGLGNLFQQKREPADYMKLSKSFCDLLQIPILTWIRRVWTSTTIDDDSHSSLIDLSYDSSVTPNNFIHKPFAQYIKALMSDWLQMLYVLPAQLQAVTGNVAALTNSNSNSSSGGGSGSSPMDEKRKHLLLQTLKWLINIDLETSCHGKGLSGYKTVQLHSPSIISTDSNNNNKSAVSSSTSSSSQYNNNNNSKVRRYKLQEIDFDRSDKLLHFVASLCCVVTSSSQDKGSHRDDGNRLAMNDMAVQFNNNHILVKELVFNIVTKHMKAYPAIVALLAAIRGAALSITQAVTLSRHTNHISINPDTETVTHISINQTVSSFYMICQYVLLELVSKVSKDLIEPKPSDKRKVFSKLEIEFRIIDQFSSIYDGPGFLVKFLEWSISPEYQSSRVASDTLNILMLRQSYIVSCFQGVSESVHKGQFAISIMSRLQDNISVLHNVWVMIDSPLKENAYIYRLRDEINCCGYEIESLVKVLSCFMPESDLLNRIVTFRSNWDNQYLAGVRNLLSLSHPAEDYHSVPTEAFLDHSAKYSVQLSELINFEPVPLVVCKCLDWLVVVEKSEVFKMFWRDQCGTGSSTSGAGSVNDIAPVLGKWSGFLKAILNGTLELCILDRYGRLLLNDSELKIFTQTASSVAHAIEMLTARVQAAADVYDDDNTTNVAAHHGDMDNDIDMDIDLDIKSLKNSYMQDHAVAKDVIHKWNHIRLFYTHEQHVKYVLSASRHHLVNSEKYRITECELAISNLCKSINTHEQEWSCQKSSDLESYWKHAKFLDHKLLKISFALLLTVEENMELINWLRTIRDDEAFYSSIEVARNLQEMNTPDVLWDHAAGRVNERYLSMISNIRSYLHAYLYEADAEVSSFELFLRVFSELNVKTKAEVIISNIKICYTVRTSLSKIIGINTDFSGASKINYLYSADCASIWHCCKTSASTSSDSSSNNSNIVGDGSVILKYKVVDTDSAASAAAAIYTTTSTATSQLPSASVYRHYSCSDLLDFQSNVVLEKSLVSGSSVTARTDTHTSELSDATSTSKDKDKDNNMTTKEEHEENKNIELFLSQFSWMRRLSEVLKQLYVCGHFDYIESYSVELSVSLTDDEFKKKTLLLELFKTDWENHVNNIRKQFYYINYFDLRRCHTLIQLLQQIFDAMIANGGCLTDTETKNYNKQLMNYFCFINPELNVSQHVSLLNKVIENLSLLFDSIKTNEMNIDSDNYNNNLQSISEFTNEENEKDIYDIGTTETSHKRSKSMLLHLANYLNVICPFFPRRVRPFIIHNIDQYVLNEPIVRGIHVAYCASLKSQYDQLITLCAIQQQLVEFESCLLCTKTTSFEQVSLLVYRWYRSHLHGRDATTFYMIEADKLSYEVQFSLVNLFKELASISITENSSMEVSSNNSMEVVSSSTSNPLVLIVESNESQSTCYLAAQFHHNRVHHGVLPQSMLSTAGAVISDMSRGIYCHTSNIPGAGKSFDIRYRAASGGSSVSGSGTHSGLSQWSSSPNGSSHKINSVSKSRKQHKKVEGDHHVESSFDQSPFPCFYSHIPINNQHIPVKLLLQRIRESFLRTESSSSASSPEDGNVLLHFDIASTASDTFVGTMFSLAVLQILHDDESTHVYFYNPKATTVCIELSAGLQYKSFSQFKLYPTIQNTSTQDTFKLDFDTLYKGMGSEFHAHLYGNLTDDITTNIEPSNAYDRLYYVVETLNTLKKLGGTFPFDHDPHVLYKKSRNKEPLSKDAAKNGFQLLLHASNLAKTMYDNANSSNSSLRITPSSSSSSSSVYAPPATSVSLWCVWSFINVLYWQLQEIQSEHSPVNLACMPDIHIKLMTVEFDTAMKARVKGEMINFIIKTAREFATRQVSTQANKDIENNKMGILVYNVSSIPESKQRDLKYLFWKRERYDNDGYPVYKSPDFYIGFNPGIGSRMENARKFNRWLHFRESENRWVIDDTVAYTGGVLFYSQDNKPLEQTKFEKRMVSSTNTVNVKVRRIKSVNPHAYNNEAVSIEGFNMAAQGLGTVCSANDDGIYLRLPPQQDINGKPHYYKESPPEHARHLYFVIQKEKNLIFWAIAKTCNAEVMGTCAYTESKKIGDSNCDFTTSNYKYYPPNQIEKDMKLKVVRPTDNIQALFTSLVSTSSSGSATAAVTTTSTKTQLSSSSSSSKLLNTPHCDDLPDSYHAAKYEQTELQIELTRWKDSNHECVFFNNETGIVSFLSLDKQVLKNNIHPVLLKHLESNNINVGEDLKNVNDTDRYWEILSATTGVNHTKEDVARIFDKSFCLTGDSLLKILAIVYRVKCKIPVVLLGECGCGKTMLISFLCKWLGVKLLTLDVHGGTEEKEIIAVFDKAQSILDFSHELRSSGNNNSNSNSSYGAGNTVFVFLDEVNTCAHMGLLNEAICHRSIYGRRLHDGIQVLAALNPYRLRPKRDEVGLTLTFNMNTLTPPATNITQSRAVAAATTETAIEVGTTTTSAVTISSSNNSSSAGVVSPPSMLFDEDTPGGNMSQLVYRVQPIPPTLKDFIFDFGSLEPETELLYIKSMVAFDSDITDILTQPDSDATLSSSTSEGGNNINNNSITHEKSLVSLLIHKCQEYIRKTEGDPSVVSLRDVKRTLILWKWFYTELPDAELHSAIPVSPVGRAFVLAIAHIYCYRLSSTSARDALWHVIAEEVKAVKTKALIANSPTPVTTSSNTGATTTTTNTASTVDEVLQVSDRLECLNDEDFMSTIVSRAQSEFVDNLEIEDGISMNQALTENLFVSIVCILNKIPIFIVGKPGTSKTLAFQVIQSNLQGRQSPKVYWRSKPSVHVFQYQCSPLSTSRSIKYMFEAAKSFQEHSTGETMCILLLDEVGLAENSPDMPLKVLHYMLVDPPIAIVGLSNWALDSSKMNRAVCLQRPEPSEKDIMLTGHNIVTAARDQHVSSLPHSPISKSKRQQQLTNSTAPSHTWLGPLAKAYLHIYTNQKEILKSSRDFYGMRDYYSLLKFLRQEIVSELTPEALVRAVARNFGGRPDSMQTLLPIFYESCFPASSTGSEPSQHSAVTTTIEGTSAKQVKKRKSKTSKSMEIVTEDAVAATVETAVTTSSDKLLPACIQSKIPPTIAMVHENVDSKTSRHLMVLSKNETVLNILFGCGIIKSDSVSVLVGSRFRDDLDDLYLIQQINQVKQAMARGEVAVLLENDNIYESLYDVLNQRYVRQRDTESGTEKKLLRLAMGSRSQLCPVEPGFKLIVIVQQLRAYDVLDLPLLNRFEKQNLSPSDILSQSPRVCKVLNRILDWCLHILNETGLSSYTSIFSGFYEETIPSLLLSLTNFCESFDQDSNGVTVSNSSSSSSSAMDIVVNDNDRNTSVFESNLELKAKRTLLKVVTPVAILHSHTLQTLIKDTFALSFETYMSSHSHLFVLLHAELNHVQSTSDTNSIDDNRLILISTRSPVQDFETSFKSWMRQGHNEEREKLISSSSSKSANLLVCNLVESDMITIQLSHVTSDRAFTRAIENFYADESESAASFIAVLCDPLYCSLSLISHARYISYQQYQIYVKNKNQISTAHVGSSKRRQRHVVFVIHLPVGVSSRKREFTLDMYLPWSYLYLDDLLSPQDIGGTDLIKMLTLNLYDLCRSRSIVEDQDNACVTATVLNNDDQVASVNNSLSPYIDLKNIILKNFQSALAQCIPDTLENDSNESNMTKMNEETEKMMMLMLQHQTGVTDVTHVKMLQILLRYPEFSNYVHECVLHCFKKLKRSVTSNSNSNSSTNINTSSHVVNAMEYHVAKACESLEDSLRKSLQTTIEVIAVNALGHVFRHIDSNFNLAWLYISSGLNNVVHQSQTVECIPTSTAVPENMTLWLSLARKLQPPNNFEETCPVELFQKPTTSDANRPVNTGLKRPVSCQFPFSEKIISYLNQPSLREQMELKFGLDLFKTSHSLQSTIESLLGSDLTHSAFQLILSRNCNPVAYLHDFVASTIYPMQYISFNSQFLLVKSILDAINIFDSSNTMSVSSVASTQTPPPAYSPSVVHAKYWAIERSQRIFTTLSALSSIKSVQRMLKDEMFIPFNIEAKLISNIQTLCKSAADTTHVTSALKDIDICVASFFLNLLKDSIESIAHLFSSSSTTLSGRNSIEVYYRIGKWAKLFSLIQNDVETIVTLAVQRDSTSTRTDAMDFADTLVNDINIKEQQTQEILQNWWFLKCLRVFISEYMNLYTVANNSFNTSASSTTAADAVTLSGRNSSSRKSIAPVALSTEPVSCFLNVLQSFRTIPCDPSSNECLKSFMNTCSNYPSKYASFVKGYLKKFLLVEFQYLGRVNRTIEVSFELLKTIGSVAFSSTTNASNSSSSGATMEVVEDGTGVNETDISAAVDLKSEVEVRELALQRAAVDILYMYSKSGNPTYVSYVNSILSESMRNDECMRLVQLFLERIENDVYETLHTTDANTTADNTSTSVSDVDLKLPLQFVSVKTSQEIIHALQKHGIGMLVALANVKINISKYSKKIHEQLRSGGVSNTKKTELLLNIPKPLDSYLRDVLDAQLYFFIQLIHFGGKPILISYLRLNHNQVPICPAGIKLIDSNSVMFKSIDVFSTLAGAEIYHDACKEILKVHSGDAIVPIQKWSKQYYAKHNIKQWNDRMNVLLAAVFTQMSNNLIDASPHMIDVCVEWMNKEFQEATSSHKEANTSIYLFRDVMKHFLSSKRSSQPIKPNTKASTPTSTTKDNTSSSTSTSNANLSTTLNDSVQQYLKLHITLLALSPNSGWLHQLLLDPKSFQHVYIPSMLDSEFSMLMNVVDANSGRVQDVAWYECPNGHRYSVGECTRPMEQAKCPDCGAFIGGTNHQDVKGVKRLGKFGEIQTESIKGYLVDVTGDRKGYDIERLGHLTTAILRYTLHSVMLLHNEMYPDATADLKSGKLGTKSLVSEMMYPSSQSVSSATVHSELVDRLTLDWNELKQIINWDDEDIAMGLHIIYNKLLFAHFGGRYAKDESKFGHSETDEQMAQRLAGHANGSAVEVKTLVMPPANMTTQARAVFEQAFDNELVIPTFVAEAVKIKIREEKKKYESDNIDRTLKSHLGELYFHVMEVRMPSSGNSHSAENQLLSLWRYREAVTFNEFQRFFNIRTSNQTEYPVMAAVLKSQNSLPLIKYCADILEWHSVIFKVFKPGMLSREEANNITNRDVVLRLPVEEQTNGWKILLRYCEAFNATITLPGYLRECASNIFVTKSNEVDLLCGQDSPQFDLNRLSPSLCTLSPSLDVNTVSGLSSLPERGMNINTCVAFSLANSLKDGNEFVDPRSLCTMFILDRLKNLHETVVDVLLSTNSNSSSTDQTTGGEISNVHPLDSKNKNSGSSSSSTLNEFDNDPTTLGVTPDHLVPLTSYLTPRALVSKRLLSFDYETHLKPLIHTYYKQHLEFGRGELLGFDLLSMESELRDSLLPSAQPFAVAVIEYTFKDEMSITGAMSKFEVKIKQEELPPSVIDQLWTEIDTQQRLTLLKALIQDVITFISTTNANAGLTSLHGDVKFHTILSDVLLIDSDKISAISCTTLKTSVCIKHLKSLMYGLVERQHDGDLFHQLLVKYKKPLLTVHQELLNKFVTKCPKDLSTVVECLKDFLVKLQDSGGSGFYMFPELYENLLYLRDGVLTERQWVADNFPQTEISVEYALETFNYLKGKL